MPKVSAARLSIAVVGGILRTTGERAAARVCDQLDETIAYDLVVVATLAHQVDAVLPALARSRARSVQFMFNTLPQPTAALRAIRPADEGLRT